MSSLGALFTVSYRQGLPVRRSVVLGLVQLAPLAIYLIATSGRTQQSQFDGLIEVGSTIYFTLVLPIVAIVIAAGALGNERRDLTLSFIALRPIARPAIAGTKIAAAFAAAATLNLIGAIGLGLAHSLRVGGTDMLVGLVLGALVATAAYAAVYVPLGFLTDRAVIIGISYLLIVENGVVFALSGLALISPWRLGMVVFVDRVEGARILLSDALGTLTTGRVLTALVVYVIAGTVITSVLLRSRDMA